MEKNKTKSWRFILIMIIIFWPIGLYLMADKLKVDKTAIFKNPNVLRIVAYFFIFFGGGSFFLILSGQMTATIDGESVTVNPFSAEAIFYYIISLAFIIGGLAIVKKYRATKKQAELYREYIQLVVNSEVTSLQEIAYALNKPLSVVNEDIKVMINRNLLGKAYINQSTNTIIFPGGSLTKETGASNRRLTNITCSGCGAKNTVIEGNHSRCEYCGSILN